MERIVYVDGTYLPEGEARISIFDRGFIFGDGVYEVTSVLDGALIDPNAHLRRLERSCAEIGLALPWTRSELLAIHEALVARNQLREGSVYLQVTRGPADRDFVFPKNTTPTLVMFTQARNYRTSPSAGGIRVVTTPDLRWARRDIKSINLLAPVLAKNAAAEKGAQEAWLVDGQDVTEGASSTAWIVVGKKLISRSLSHKVLPGITREAVLAFLAETDFGFEERSFTVAEAQRADEAFITSATSFVTPVVDIDGKPVNDGRAGPVATRLRTLYTEIASRGGSLR